MGLQESTSETMLLSEADRIFKRLHEELHTSDRKLTALYNDMMTKAIDYAGIRSEWLLMSYDERQDASEERSLLLDTFIFTVNVLSAEMDQRQRDIEWRELLGSERKRIGDWACYLALFYALNSR